MKLLPFMLAKLLPDENGLYVPFEKHDRLIFLGTDPTDPDFAIVAAPDGAVTYHPVKLLRPVCGTCNGVDQHRPDCKLQEASKSSNEHKCIDCYTPLTSGAYYGAGNGTGQKFRCEGCHWRNEAKKLEAEISSLKRERDNLLLQIRVATTPPGVNQPLIDDLERWRTETQDFIDNGARAINTKASEAVYAAVLAVYGDDRGASEVASKVQAALNG